MVSSCTGESSILNSEDDHKLKKLRSIETGKETNIEIICYVCGSSKDKHRHPLLCKVPTEVCGGKYLLSAHEVKSDHARATMRKKWGPKFRFLCWQ